MQLKELEIQERAEFGTTSVNRMRRAGFIPGVVYSEGKAARAVGLTAMNYSHVIAGSSSTQLYKLKSSNKELNGLMALIKEVQHEPLKDKVLHVDFLSVSEGHRIGVTIPIRITGEAEAVKLGLMLLNQTMYEIQIECLPTEIPNEIVVDISGLREGHPIHVKDLTPPKGVAFKVDLGLSVVGLIAKAEEEEVKPAAAAATPEGATAEGQPAAAAGGAAAGATAAPAEKEKGKEKK